ncbi:hypothetical protein [Streptomyces capitiformicae]|uniref:hypothetical protein n=1 Tax=Streptomyces capitiformicae TaxID=2014920 RepID=UPI001675D144|nr:hypothetical protein [Streptomyces capitiformicae]
MAAMVIVGIGGEQPRRLAGRMVNAIGLQCGGGGCAGGEVSLDTLHMDAVRHEEAEQEHGQGQHTQQRTRTGAGPDDAPERPSRNHAVILAARRQ